MEISKELAKWYLVNKRDLQWRQNKNPYFIWVSEIMLQQTTVNAVKPYFQRFIATFPTVEGLAQAPEDKVLGQWSGLGYYSRARNLLKAAKEIVKKEAFPNTSVDLQKLPGIGPYTSAAIASIAFGEETPAIDGNVVRVISRLLDLEEVVTTKNCQKVIAEYAGKLIHKQDPSEHNQAMMELGATICTPKNPFCLSCPVHRFCLAFKKGTVLDRPVKTPKRALEPWFWEMYLVKNKRKIALVKENNRTPWLKDLWVLPGRAQPWKDKYEPPFDFKHSITHHKIFVKLLIQSGDRRDGVEFLKGEKIKWVLPQNLHRIGVSSIVQKALKAAALLSLVCHLGCKSAPKQPPSPLAGASPGIAYRSAESQLLTKSGINQMAQFSPDGTKIIFLSQNRPDHKKSQVYILNLKTNRDRRITFNDGDDSAPTFDPSGEKILYSSTTDEIKEHALVNPPITDPLVDNSKASFDELYESNADGSHIVRLTNDAGFDGNGVYSPDGRTIAFSSQKEGQFKIYLMDGRGRHHRFLTRSSDFEYAPAFSPSGKTIVYESRSDKSPSVHLALSDLNGHTKLLTNYDGIQRDPSFSPDGKQVVFSSNKDNPKFFNLYLISIDGQCLKRITTGEQNDFFPHFSKSGQQIIYTSDKTASLQVYINDFAPPEECLKDRP